MNTDPNTSEELFWDKDKPQEEQWIMGYIKDNEYDYYHTKFANKELSKKEFLTWYRDLENYKPRSLSHSQDH